MNPTIINGNIKIELILDVDEAVNKINERISTLREYVKEVKTLYENLNLDLRTNAVYNDAIEEIDKLMTKKWRLKS